MPTAPLPPELSLVVPVYNERDNLPLLVGEIAQALRGVGTGRRYEIVAVDDGSTDGSLEVLKALKRDHPELHIVAFAENAGQTAAFAAGFRAARGGVIVTLDADLQNDPADIPALHPAHRQGVGKRSPHPVPHAVLRRAEAPGPMLHGDLRYRAAVQLHQGRQEAVHAAVQR